MATPRKRRSFAEMDHDDEPLYQRLTRATAVVERGPVAEFLAKKKAEQEPKTYIRYRTAVTRFADFLGQDGRVGDVNDAAGHRFLTHLKEVGLSRNTLATYVRDVKCFARWMHEAGWTERNRLAGVKQPSFVRPKFDTLTLEQKQAIVSDFNPETFLGARNIALLCLLLDTGMRREEAAHLLWERVHLREGYIEVYSRKTSEWRIIPLSAETVSVCEHYQRVLGEFAQTAVRHRIQNGRKPAQRTSMRSVCGDTFFCSWTGKPLTENAIGLLIRRLRERLAGKGVVVRLHAHLFRHCFATEKALDGENPSIVRRWMGHKSFEMTDYYFGLAEQKFAAIKPKQSTLAGVTILPKKKGRTREEERPKLNSA